MASKHPRTVKDYLKDKKATGDDTAKSRGRGTKKGHEGKFELFFKVLTGKTKESETDSIRNQRVLRIIQNVGGKNVDPRGGHTKGKPDPNERPASPDRSRSSRRRKSDRATRSTSKSQSEREEEVMGNYRPIAPKPADSGPTETSSNDSNYMDANDSTEVQKAESDKTKGTHVITKLKQSKLDQFFKPQHSLGTGANEQIMLNDDQWLAGHVVSLDDLQFVDENGKPIPANVTEHAVRENPTNEAPEHQTSPTEGLMDILGSTIAMAGINEGAMIQDTQSGSTSESVATGASSTAMILPNQAEAPGVYPIVPESEDGSMITDEGNDGRGKTSERDNKNNDDPNWRFYEEDHNQSNGPSSPRSPSFPEDFDEMQDVEQEARMWRAEQEKELQKVQAAINQVGGLFSKAQDPEALAKREGIKLVLKNESVRKEDIQIKPEVERPAESTLRRITLGELLPAPAAMKVQPKISTEIVAEQKIEFLVTEQRTDRPEGAWGFPSKEDLEKMFEEVRQSIDNDDILEAAIWCGVNKATTIATVLLNTKYFSAMQEFRQAVRNYDGIEGRKYNTYPKNKFVKQNGATIYIPRKYAKWNRHRIMRFLFKAYPDLKASYTILHETHYTAEAPGYKTGQRSQIGDLILKLEGREFLDGLRKYRNDATFNLGGDWKISIRGGIRLDDEPDEYGEEANSSSFSDSFRSKIMMASVKEAAERESRGDADNDQ